MSTIGGIGLSDGALDLMTPSEIKRLQNFYGIKFDELFDVDRLKELGVKQSEIEYILKNRNKELAYKDTVGFELGEGVVNSHRFKQIQEFYGISLEDTQNVKTMEAKGVKQEDIEFITGKKTKEKAKLSTKATENGSTNKGAEGSSTKSSKTTK